MKIRVLPQEDSLAPKFQIIAETQAEEVFLKQFTGEDADANITLSEVVFNGDGVSSFVVTSDALGIIAQDTNFANTNLTFTEDREHELDTNSLIIRQSGVHSLQLGADVPAGIFPIPDLKFSGFTGSNAADGFMTLNGMLKGLPGTGNVYSPVSVVSIGQPLEGNGEYFSSVTFIEEVSAGVFGIVSFKSYTNTSENIDLAEVFSKGDKIMIDANDGEKVKWKLGKDGSFTHDGAYATTGIEVYQAGGSHTIPDNVSLYVYDPASVQAGATITLPANPLDGQTLYIFGGGTVTSGNVITGFTLDGNGRTVIGNGASQLKVGKALELHYNHLNNIWYAREN